MPPKSLRSQLNQIRAWVRQGRTDAWIAHQLEVSASELREFRRQHGLAPDDEGAAMADIDLRDEIEAEIEAAAEAEDEAAEEPEEPEEDSEADEASIGAQERVAEPEDEEAAEPDYEEVEERPRRRRRRGRRGGRGRRSRRTLEATFDHGEEEGFGLWLDPAVQDNPNYAEHWAGHREVTVTIEPEQIVIRRSGADGSGRER
jgi:hypothetical protein